MNTFTVVLFALLALCLVQQIAGKDWEQADDKQEVQDNRYDADLRQLYRRSANHQQQQYQDYQQYRRQLNRQLRDYQRRQQQQSTLEESTLEEQ